MLELNNINVFYGNVHALKDISLEVKKGEVVTLIGANGAGKTSILRAISNLENIKGGEITYNDENIKNIGPHKITKKKICHVPEGRRIFGELTVLENLKLGAYLRKDKQGIKQDLEMVMEQFPRLNERSKQISGTLSGGEQQMLAIGRALMGAPELLMMDEPSMGLAPIIADQIFENIVNINKMGTTILLVEQNANIALYIADRGYVLETGRIILHGDAKDLLEDDTVRKAYLGE